MSMRGRPTLVLVALVLGALIAGCTVTDKAAMKRGLYVDEHPELSEALAEALINGRVMVGMTQEMVEVAWGKPVRVEPIKAEDVVSHWIYGNYFVAGTTTSLFFDLDGVLVRYEVKNQEGNVNSGSLSLAGSNPDAVKVGADGSLEKGTGGRP